MEPGIAEANMKHIYVSGAEARRNFEEGMMKLFRIPKSVVAKKPESKKTPAPKGDSEK